MILSHTTDNNNGGFLNFNDDHSKYFLAIYHILYALYKNVRKIHVKFFQTLFVVVLIVILTALIMVLLPIVYPILLYYIRSTTKKMQMVKSMLPELSLKQLNSISDILDSIEKDYKIKDEISKLDKAPFFIKPIALIIKSDLEQYVELRQLVDTETQHTINLFNLGLETNTLIGTDHEF